MKNFTESDNPLLIYHIHSKTYWPNTAIHDQDKDQYIDAYKLLGWLIASAIIHQCSFHIPLPRLFFRHIISRDSKPQIRKIADLENWNDIYYPTFNDLNEWDQQTAKSVSSITNIPDDAFFNLLKEENMSLDTSRNQYKNYILYKILVQSSKWQFDYIRHGFRLAFDHQIGIALLDLIKLDSNDMLEILCNNISYVKNDNDSELGLTSESPNSTITGLNTIGSNTTATSPGSQQTSEKNQKKKKKKNAEKNEFKF